MAGKHPDATDPAGFAAAVDSANFRGDSAAPDSLRAGLTSALARPGDTLVVATPAGGTPGQIAELRAGLEALLPGVAVVTVTHCTGLAIYRPEITGPEITQEEPPAGDSASTA